MKQHHTTVFLRAYAEAASRRINREIKITEFRSADIKRWHVDIDGVGLVRSGDFDACQWAIHGFESGLLAAKTRRK